MKTILIAALFLVAVSQQTRAQTSSLSSTRTLGSSSVRDTVFFSETDTISLYGDDFNGLSLLENHLDNKVFITGENHTYTESNARIWLKMIKYLYKKAGVRNVMFEYGYTYGFLVNEYLQSGDTTLYNSIDQFAYQEYSDVLKELKEFNDSLPIGEKLYFTGVDIERGVYPLAKALAYLLPDDSISMHDSISLHIQSIRSLEAYNDFKLDEQEDDSKVYTRGRGFNFMSQSTLEEVQKNFLKFKLEYKGYLGINYKQFEDIIENKFNDRSTWQKYEKKRMVQQYLFRENYMHAQFLKEAEAHSGGWFGQFGRCHTTRGEQETNSCEWFRFSSLADRIESTKTGKYRDSVFTAAIVYSTDKNFGPTKKANRAFNKYFEDLEPNSVSILDFSKDTSLSKLFNVEFDLLILNANEKRGEFYTGSTIDYKTNPGKLLLSFTNHEVDLQELNDRFVSEGANAFSANELTSVDFSINVLSGRSYSATTVGIYLPQSNDLVLGLNSINYKLKGWYAKSQYFVNLTKKVKFVDIAPGLGIGYHSLILEALESSNTGTVSTGYIGETKYSQTTNPAFVIDISGLAEMNLGPITLGYMGGYNFDVSNKKWRSDGDILNDSPSTNFSGMYGTFRVGVNF